MKFVRLLKAKKIKAEEILTTSMLEKAIDEYDQTGKINDILKRVEPTDIGQGYGYKLFNKDWNDIQLDEVIYIPEYGYREGTDIPESYYTKQDFLNIVGGNDRRAQNLFSDVDWQSPETLAYEWDWLTDYNETGKNAPEDFEPKYDEKGQYKK